jgi:hypothetical protein
MLSSLSSIVNHRGYSIIESPTFTSFPSSLVVRYDLFSDSGRLTSTDTTVTTNNAHIYKIVDKSGNGHHMISKGTDTNNANTYIISGLGLNKPCLAIKYTTPSTMGYSTGASIPLFPDGFELICVIRPTQPTTGTIRQILLNKSIVSNGIPNGFDIKFDRVIADGTTTARVTSWNQESAVSGALNMRTTATTGFIMSTRFFKTNSTNNGRAYDRKNGQDIYNIFVTNNSFYADSSSRPLNLCWRPDQTLSTSYEIGEIMMFNAELPSSQRELMEGYLATKWGIPLSNTSHTYYNKSVVFTGSNP